MSPDIATLLDAAATRPYEQCDDAWRKLIRLLRLKPLYIPAVQKILSQDRWRSQPDPIAYVRKGAMRQAIRMQLLDLPLRDERMVLASDLGFTDSDGEPVPHDEKLDLALANYEERFGPHYDDGSDHYLPSDRVSEAFRNDSDAIDWEHAADLAGLDGGERMVLEVQLLGLGRERALALCYKEEDRKLLQAAWKRFTRHRKALKATLLSGKAHQSRRIRGEARDRLELVLVEMPDGTARISFEKLVPDTPI